jgi:hypothetical protein
MSIYCVAFRIADKSVSGRTYNDRRQSVEDAIVTKDQGFWDELASFYLVESHLRTQDFAKKASASLSVADDLLVVFDPSDMSVGYFGKFEGENVLKSFFKHSSRV